MNKKKLIQDEIFSNSLSELSESNSKENDLSSNETKANEDNSFWFKPKKVIIKCSKFIKKSLIID